MLYWTECDGYFKVIWPGRGMLYWTECDGYFKVIWSGRGMLYLDGM